jgi:hypothetical protein
MSDEQATTDATAYLPEFDSGQVLATVFGGDNDQQAIKYAKMHNNPAFATKGRWGGDITSKDFPGVSLPASVLEQQFGDIHHPDFVQKVRADKIKVNVTNPKTGATATGILRDVGPGPSEAGKIDLMPGLAALLGIGTDANKSSGQVTYSFAQDSQASTE